MSKPKRDPRIVVGSKWMLWLGDIGFGPYEVVAINDHAIHPILMVVEDNGRVRNASESYEAFDSYQYLSGLEDIIYKRLMED
jgi:hypothetical protein